MKKIKIVAIVPARGGSKGLKNKNILPLKGKPLIAHSIIVAKKCGFDKIIVSTDSKKIQKIAIKNGAEAPFLRPKKYSGDSSLDNDYFNHCYNWYLKKKKFQIDIFVNLRPTTPLRDYKVIWYALQKFKRKKLNFLRSAHIASESPLKWFKRKTNGFFKPITLDSNLNMTNFRRQDFEPIYIPNGYVDILSTKFMNKKNIYGNKMYVFVTKKVFEIDTLEDYIFLKKIS